MEVFDSNELLKTIDMVETTNEIITNYLDNNTWELMQEKKNKNNGVLKKSIKDNVNKSVIMEALNTLNNNNFDNSVNNIKSLTFNNIEEFKELVVLVFNKLKSTIKANKIFIARLCYSIKNMYFIDENNDKKTFENLLREYTKFEYDNIMKEYEQDKSHKILSAIVYLYQSSFFNLNIINIIITDLKKEIEYNYDLEQARQYMYMSAEKELESMKKSRMISKKLYSQYLKVQRDSIKKTERKLAKLIDKHPSLKEEQVKEIENTILMSHKNALIEGYKKGHFSKEVMNELIKEVNHKLVQKNEH